jgi:hypothetical protein
LGKVSHRNRLRIVLEGPVLSEATRGVRVPLGVELPSAAASFEKAIMSALFRFLVAWIIFGAIAATLTFGPALLRVVAFGPISLLQVMVA